MCGSRWTILLIIAFADGFAARQKYFNPLKYSSHCGCKHVYEFRGCILPVPPFRFETQTLRLKGGNEKSDSVIPNSTMCEENSVAGAKYFPENHIPEKKPPDLPRNGTEGPSTQPTTSATANDGGTVTAFEVHNRNFCKHSCAHSSSFACFHASRISLKRGS